MRRAASGDADALSAGSADEEELKARESVSFRTAQISADGIQADADKEFLELEEERQPEAEGEKPLITDCEEFRQRLPVLGGAHFKASQIWPFVKDAIGKDLTTISLPVFINEPLTTLQKSAELFCYSDEFFSQAVKEESSAKRMVYVAAYALATYCLVKGRTQKPFNPLLGETYELVTPAYRYLSELVSHHPPVLAVNCQGEGWEVNKNAQTIIKFTGRQVSVEDPNLTTLDLYPVSCQKSKVKKETYTMSNPKICVGNLIIGERYIEPQGPALIENKWTGDTCALDFKIRGGWLSTQAANIHAVEGVVRNAEGQEKFRLTGKYSSEIVAEDLTTGEKWTVFKAPAVPEDAAAMHQMGFFSLQLNLLPPALEAKLPPTDSRLRKDVRAWEHSDLEAAQAEKYRLETNQRARRKEVKELLKRDGVEMNMYDEQSFYQPRFFDKQTLGTDSAGKPRYMYRPKPGNYYWQKREERDWSGVPHIFEDECQPFYK